jgi:hypothetical protein
MTHPPLPHECRPLWVGGRARATCRSHWWRLLGITAAGAQ